MFQHDEEARLAALYSLNLLDTAPSESFDRITRMAGQIFGLPIAAVSLTDQDRQWFKSRIAVDHCSIPRHKAPCAQVAERGETLLSVLTPLPIDEDIASLSAILLDEQYYAALAANNRTVGDVPVLDERRLNRRCLPRWRRRTNQKRAPDGLTRSPKPGSCVSQMQCSLLRVGSLRRARLPSRNALRGCIGRLGTIRPSATSKLLRKAAEICGSAGTAWLSQAPELSSDF